MFNVLSESGFANSKIESHIKKSVSLGEVFVSLFQDTNDFHWPNTDTNDFHWPNTDTIDFDFHWLWMSAKPNVLTLKTKTDTNDK